MIREVIAGEPVILRRTQVLERFAPIASVEISPDDYFLGSQKFCAFCFPNEINAELQTLGYAKNIGHIIYDYAGLVQEGVAI